MPPPGKSMRLTFKGDAPKRKRPKTTEGRSKRRVQEGAESDVESVGGDEQAWVPAEEPAEMSGPTFLHQAADGGAAALTFNATMGKVDVSHVAPPALPGDEAALADGALVVATEITPQSVHQVWVATQMPMTNSWTLKSTQGTFLSCDRYGGVHADSEARGPQEEWTLKRVESAIAHPADAPLPSDTVLGVRRGIALQSHYGGWLALETTDEGKRSVRADATELGDACVWDASVQWKFRHAVRATRRAARRDAPAGAPDVLDEERLSRSRPGWNAGTRAHTAVGPRSELLRAQREGRLSEAMLDRRAALKSDKYAK